MTVEIVFDRDSAFSALPGMLRIENRKAETG